MDFNEMTMGMGVVSSSQSEPTNVRKKRRTNSTNTVAAQRAAAMVASIKTSISQSSGQDFTPPSSTGYNDTIIANNPFDDLPNVTTNMGMCNNSPLMQLNQMSNMDHHGMNSIQAGNGKCMNPVQGNRMNQMLNNGMAQAQAGLMDEMQGGTMNHGMLQNLVSACQMTQARPHLPTMNNVNLMAGMRANLQQAAMAPMNHHMDMRQPMAGQMNNSLMNNNLINNPRENLRMNLMGTGVGNPLFEASVMSCNYRPPNSTGPNYINNAPNSYSMTNSFNNGTTLQNVSHIRQNQMNGGMLIRPPMSSAASTSSAFTGPFMTFNRNCNMARSQLNIPNGSNLNANNLNQANNLGHMSNNISNEQFKKPSVYGANGDSILKHRLQGNAAAAAAAAANSKPMSIKILEDRIFPPDQPLVFDQRNPNAPPISPCGVCRKEVKANEQAIFCESGCNFWFHRRCVGLSESAYAMLMQEAYAEWVCSKCLLTKNVPLVKIKP